MERNRGGDRRKKKRPPDFVERMRDVKEQGRPRKHRDKGARSMEDTTNPPPGLTESDVRQLAVIRERCRKLVAEATGTKNKNRIEIQKRKKHTRTSVIRGYNPFRKNRSRIRRLITSADGPAKEPQLQTPAPTSSYRSRSNDINVNVRSKIYRARVCI